jgi:hypothetical protein
MASRFRSPGIPEQGNFVNQFTFREPAFYLCLAKNEAKQSRDAEEDERTDEYYPVAAARFDQSFEVVAIQRDQTAVGVRLQDGDAGEIDERRHDQQSDQQCQPERDRFEAQRRLREIPLARACEPGEQGALDPVTADRRKARA